MLIVKISQVADMLLVTEQCIEEADQQFLVHVRAEQLLETEIGVWVHKALLTAVIVCWHRHIVLFGHPCKGTN